MDSQRSSLPLDEPLHVAAATLLLLAGTTACSNETPPWGRERTVELVDALLVVAVKHGFAQTDVLRAKLTTGTRTKRAWLLAEVAFDAVPASALLDVIRQSGFYIGEQVRSKFGYGTQVPPPDATEYDIDGRVIWLARLAHPSCFFASLRNFWDVLATHWGPSVWCDEHSLCRGCGHSQAHPGLTVSDAFRSFSNDGRHGANDRS